MRGAGFLVLVLVACDDGGGTGPDAGGDAPAPHSGSRLHLKWIESGGERLVAGIHDVELDADCRFVRTADDVMRCLPRYPAHLEGYLADFADAACTRPVHVISPAECASTPPTRVTAYLNQGCAPPRVLELGERVRPAVIYERRGTECVAQAAGDAEIYAVGPEVALDAFVAATEDVVGAGRIQRVDLVGEDGSRVFGTLRDTEAGSDCSFASDGGPYDRCVPMPHAWTPRWYQDRTCETPVPAFSTSWAPTCTPDLVLVRDERDDDARLYRKGDERAPAPHYEQRAGACVEVGASPSVRAYSLGDEIPLAEGTAIVEGTGPIRERFAETGTGADAVRQPVGYWDAARGISCWPSHAADGSLRCIAFAQAWAEDLFADDRCTEPVRVARSGARDDAEAPRYAVQSKGLGCEPRFHQFRLGDEIQDPHAWTRVGDACMPAPLAPSRVFAIVAEEAPTDLPDASTIID